MILIDDRQGSGEFDSLISAPHVLCRLEYADFAWPGSGPDGPVDVGVERKSLLDLLQSISSGRLSGHQIIGLTQSYDHVYLLVEGVWRPDRRSGTLMRIGGKGQWIPAAQGSRRFMARDLFNFFNSLSIICGITVIQTGNKWETAKWLDASHSWWSKPWEKHRSHLQFRRPEAHAQLVKPSLATRMACQFDGIGWDKARSLGNRFPLPEDLIFASEADLMEVPGIGKGLAESIIKQRNGEV